MDHSVMRKMRGVPLETDTAPACRGYAWVRCTPMGMGQGSFLSGSGDRIFTRPAICRNGAAGVFFNVKSGVKAGRLVAARKLVEVTFGEAKRTRHCVCCARSAVFQIFFEFGHKSKVRYARIFRQPLCTLIAS